MVTLYLTILPRQVQQCFRWVVSVVGAAGYMLRTCEQALWRHAAAAVAMGNASTTGYDDRCGSPLLGNGFNITAAAAAAAAAAKGLQRGAGIATTVAPDI